MQEPEPQRMLPTAPLTTSKAKLGGPTWRAILPQVSAHFEGVEHPELTRQEKRYLKRKIAKLEASQVKPKLRQLKAKDRKTAKLSARRQSGTATVASGFPSGTACTDTPKPPNNP